MSTGVQLCRLHTETSGTAGLLYSALTALPTSVPDNAFEKEHSTAAEHTLDFWCDFYLCLSKDTVSH